MSTATPEPLKVLVLTAELSPWFSSGTLGERVRADVDALAAAGHATAVLLPYSPAAKKRGEKLETIATDVKFTFAGEDRRYDLLRAPNKSGTADVVFIDAPDFFRAEPDLYGNVKGPQGVAGLRWFYFAAVARHAAFHAGLSADVVVGHDWPGALAVALLRADGVHDATLSKIATVLCVHAPEHQGEREIGDYLASGLREDIATPWYAIHDGRVNLLKAGLVLADKIVAPSHLFPSIMQRGGGFGLEFVWESRKDDIEKSTPVAALKWSPTNTELVPMPFSAEDPSGRAVARAALFARFGWQESAGPVVAFTGPLTADAGAADILRSAKAMLSDPDTRLVICGRGDSEFEERFRQMVSGAAKRAGVLYADDEKTIAAVLAGADIALCPHEPPRAAQAAHHAARMGAIPVVRTVDGRAGSHVLALPESSDAATAFGYEVAGAAGLLETYRRARKAFLRPKTWTGIQKRAMELDEPDDRAEETVRVLRAAVAARVTRPRDAKVLVRLLAPKGHVELPPQRAIPEHYGRDTVHLMPKDPYYVFAYWEAEGPIGAAIKAAGLEAPGLLRWELRMTNVSTQSTWSIDLDGTARNWFVKVDPHRRYLAEVWVHVPGKDSILLGRSIFADTPPKTDHGG